MKKFALITSLCLLTALAGCAGNESTDKRGIYQRSGNTINVNTKRNELYDEGSARDIRNVSNNYGYVRHQKSPVMGNKDTNYYASLNREQVANIISRYCTSLPNVHDVAALVTDQEVLIGYRTDSKNRNLTADQVKHTAFSVVPRYYHVYVSDNTQLIRDIENLSHLDSASKSARRNVTNIIAKMKKSPQGTPLSTNENANGETPDDVISRPNL